MLVNPNSFLERIQKDNLDTYLKHEIEQQDIDLNFDYGVYSKKEMSFIIMNGHLMVVPFLVPVVSTACCRHPLSWKSSPHLYCKLRGPNGCIVWALFGQLLIFFS